MKINCYKDLSVWQKSMKLVEECYRFSDGFPRNEEFGLKSQMRRAAVSIPSNIAEGNARCSSGEYRQFLSIALGSAAELEAQIELARRLGFLPEAQARLLSEECQEIGRMLYGLRAAITKRLPAHSPRP
ncbi:MAG: four helix bundle protein [Bacteroidota bacterium]